MIITLLKLTTVGLPHRDVNPFSLVFISDVGLMFVLFQAWVDQQTTSDLLEAKQKKRERFGDEVDFEAYEKPLKQNINQKIQEFERTQS